MLQIWNAVAPLLEECGSEMHRARDPMVDREGGSPKKNSQSGFDFYLVVVRVTVQSNITLQVAMQWRQWGVGCIRQGEFWSLEASSICSLTPGSTPTRPVGLPEPVAAI